MISRVFVASRVFDELSEKSCWIGLDDARALESRSNSGAGRHPPDGKRRSESRVARHGWPAHRHGLVFITPPA